MNLLAVAQSALEPAGPQSGRINSIWWLLFWVSALVWAVVIACTLYALFRRRRETTPETERHLTRNVTVATILTTVILLGLLVTSVVTGRGLASMPTANVMNLEVIGHQWWWEVGYPDGPPDQQVTTANEIHVPVGRPIRLKVTSQDVIHSFWVPNLYGKIDLIPDHTNITWFQADRPGTFRGQCAEFCGYQHAHMALLVIAEPADRFAAWMDQQRKAAVPPTAANQIRGQEVFLSSPCVVCHTLRGSGAFGHVGPDLTHLASRQTIAAGTLPNTRGHLSGWIVDSQRIKPGNHMPPMNLPSENMEPLLAYLQALK